MSQTQLNHTNTATKQLLETEVTELLGTGQTYAVEVIGELLPSYLELLVGGLVSAFRATVMGKDNRIPRWLAEYGGDVRIAPMPIVEHRWQLQVFQAGGALQLAGQGETLEEATLFPAWSDYEREIPGFGLFAAFDDLSFSSSWEAHPRELHAEFVKLMRQPERYHARLQSAVKYLLIARRLGYVLAVVGWALATYYFVRGRSNDFGLAGIISGLVAIGLMHYLQRTTRRLMRFMGATYTPPGKT